MKKIKTFLGLCPPNPCWGAYSAPQTSSCHDMSLWHICFLFCKKPMHPYFFCIIPWWYISGFSPVGGNLCTLYLKFWQIHLPSLKFCSPHKRPLHPLTVEPPSPNCQHPMSPQFLSCPYCQTGIKTSIRTYKNQHLLTFNIKQPIVTIIKKLVLIKIQANHKRGIFMKKYFQHLL